ncbi:MAG: TonB-dependent receptor [bacterium]|nr:TonB-dependent receptor [bacterium]
MSLGCGKNRLEYRDAPRRPGRFSYLWTFLILLGGTGLLQASDPNEIHNESIDELSLQDLMQIRVVTASKRSEAMNESPGITSVITREEIEAFAARNLGEVLQRAPGTQLLTANVFPDNVVSFRGQSTTPYNNHVLFLLNGRPLRDPVTGGLNGVILTTFPLDVVERIEIVRGPGSVLYGSLAYSAVVNIVTRDPDEDDKWFELRLGGGSFSTMDGAITAASNSKDLSLLVGAQGLVSDGPTYSFFDTAGDWGSDEFNRKTLGAMLNLEYSGFTFTALFSEFEFYSLNGGTMTWAPGTKWEKTPHSRYFTNLGYAKDLSPTINLEGNLTYNRHEWTASQGVQTGNEWLAELTARWAPNPQLNIVGGGTYTVEDYAGQLLINNTLSSYSLYLQAGYWVNDNVQLIGGAQWNDLETVASRVSPRLGLVVTSASGFGLKLLHAEAFRKAYPHETSFDHPVFRGNLKVEPEIISTTELQLSHSRSNHRIALTFFRSRMSEIIGRQWIPEDNPFGGYLIHGNFGHHDFWGAELEAEFALGPDWLITGSASYQTNEDDDEIKNAALHPNTTAKIGVLYRGDFVRVGIFNSYFSSPTSVLEANPDVPRLNPEPQSLTLLSAKVTLDLVSISKLTRPRALTLSFEGQNLLDEDIRYPEYTSRQINTLTPLRGGRSFHLTFALGF